MAKVSIDGARGALRLLGAKGYLEASGRRWAREWVVLRGPDGELMDDPQAGAGGVKWRPSGVQMDASAEDPGEILPPDGSQLHDDCPTPVGQGNVRKRHESDSEMTQNGCDSASNPDDEPPGVGGESTSRDFEAPTDADRANLHDAPADLHTEAPDPDRAASSRARIPRPVARAEVPDVRLTELQNAAWRAAVQIEDDGHHPTAARVAAACGLPGATVGSAMTALVTAGVIHRSDAEAQPRYEVIDRPADMPPAFTPVPPIELPVAGEGEAAELDDVIAVLKAAGAKVERNKTDGLYDVTTGQSVEILTPRRLVQAANNILARRKEPLFALPELKP